MDNITNKAIETASTSLSDLGTYVWKEYKGAVAGVVTGFLGGIKFGINSGISLMVHPVVIISETVLGGVIGHYLQGQDEES